LATEISGRIQNIEISGSQLTIAQVAAVARRQRRVQLSDVPEVRKKILASRQIFEEKLREFIDALPRNPAGKVLKRELRLRERERKKVA
jgi:acyl-CoA synthetase (AMP-forming)/AMP-acid ligase II